MIYLLAKKSDPIEIFMGVSPSGILTIALVSLSSNTVNIVSQALKKIQKNSGEILIYRFLKNLSLQS